MLVCGWSYQALWRLGSRGPQQLVLPQVLVQLVALLQQPLCVLLLLGQLQEPQVLLLLVVLV
jgi:hypothetical protein